MTILFRCRVAAFLLPLLSSTTLAHAQPVADFYRGKPLELIVGSGAGGGYDLVARLLARYLGQYVPGQPTVVVNNMEGAGGIRAANFLFNVSPHDGSVIGTFSNAMITEPLMGNGAAKFDPAKLTWIGSVSREDGVCVSWHGSGVESWADLLQTKLIIGTAGPGTTTYTYPTLLRNMFGARFELVSGYPDGNQSSLAMERGEVQSICQTLSSLQTLHPKWLHDGLARPLLLLGLQRNADFPDLPSVMEFAKDPEQQQILKIVLAPTLAGRPFFGPPGIPSDRADALRAAFAAAVKDPALLADAHAQGLDVKPASGAEIATLVSEIYRTPPDEVAALRRMTSPAK
jgi:tripartite-type tricarboxylate transporter receptor subunit TctC